MDFERQIDLIIDDFHKSSRLLIALGDATRQSILITLMSAPCDGMRVGEITARTHLSRPAVSHHLKILREAGLVQVWPEGTMNFYTCNLGAEFQYLYNLTHHIEEFRAAAAEIQTEDGSCSHPEGA